MAKVDSNPPIHAESARIFSSQRKGMTPVPGDCRSQTREALTDPFATLIAARDAIRELKKSGQFKEPLTVLVRGGTYYLSGSVIFTAEDSGTESCPITYRAYPDERPVFSGARQIENWRPYRGEIIQCTLPDVLAGRWNFRQLFFNGRRQVRARFPNYDS